MSTPKYHWEDFKAGDTAEYGPRLVTAEEIKAFAQRFDPQLMHLDEAAAAKTIMGGLCASGWHTCAIIMRMMVDGFLHDSASMGAPGVEEVRWLKPLRPGDRLLLRTTVLETRPSRSRPDSGFVRMMIEGFDAAGEKIISMTATLMQRRRASAPAVTDTSADAVAASAAGARG